MGSGGWLGTYWVPPSKLGLLDDFARAENPPPSLSPCDHGLSMPTDTGHGDGLLCPRAHTFSPVFTIFTRVYKSQHCSILVHTTFISRPTSSEQNGAIALVSNAPRRSSGASRTARSLVSLGAGPGPVGAEKFKWEGPRGPGSVCLVSGIAGTCLPADGVRGAWKASQQAPPSPQLAAHLFKDPNPF